jgi:hypothetical protein
MDKRLRGGLSRSDEEPDPILSVPAKAHEHQPQARPLPLPGPLPHPLAHGEDHCRGHRDCEGYISSCPLTTVTE